jgi:hypothetical protein
VGWRIGISLSVGLLTYVFVKGAVIVRLVDDSGLVLFLFSVLSLPAQFVQILAPSSWWLAIEQFYPLISGAFWASLVFTLMTSWPRLVRAIRLTRA